MLKEMIVNSIIQHIEDNLENYFITIDNLVDYSGYSRRYLQITFKEYMGIPIGKYIRVRRASRAAALLRLTKLSIIDISERLFYDSQQTFTREFKKIMGYTPRQYRCNSFWSFENLLGRRDVNRIYPTPTLCYLKRKEVFGKIFDHKELILYTGVDTRARWGRAYSHFINNDTITVSNMIPFNNNDNIIARTVIWTEKESSDCSIIIDEGLYAHFQFTVPMEQYIHCLYNIYYNSLPIYNLNKRDAYDIEIISKNENGTLTCQYYLPVFDECTIHVNK
ncbi:helix-turn-helix domain-containing protein [Escherichia coli]|nr:helix-turn-helix domain-containing protein [Escherichia coli]ELO5051212.1 helix-turn-helix domain-containing protein [Escherichia coli]